MGRNRGRAVISACATLALVAGCGGSSGSSGTVSATAYAGQVCTSVASWYRSIQSQAARLEGALNAKAGASESKKQLEELLSAALTGTDNAISSLRGAGVPQVSNGQKIASKLVASFEGAAANLKKLQSRAAALSTGNADALRAEAKTIVGEVSALPLTLSSGMAGLSSPELTKASSESATCKNVGASPAGH